MRQLIEQAEHTYFEPDLFRLNVNNAIQTARTITFIIQKNKAKIDDFDNWYKKSVLDRFSTDRIMNWLKESRNQIEKEGDLVVNSECALETVFSYTDVGPRMSLKDEGMLFVGIKKLVRHIREIFPTGIFRDSAIAIDRRWVATTLPDMELTDALYYGYEELLRVVDALDEHIGVPAAQMPRWRRSAVGSRLRRSYLKTNDGKIYSLSDNPMQRLEIDTETLKKKYDVEIFRSAFRAINDPHVAIERFSETVSYIYTKDGYHITIGFLLNGAGDLVSIQLPNFADHTDKLIFWTELARSAEADKEIRGVIFISEIWFRSMEGFPQKRISDLTITGEGVQIVVANRDVCLMKTIPIMKSDRGAFLDLPGAKLETEGNPNFLVPLRRVWERAA